MRQFQVTIRTAAGQRVTYTALGRTSAAVAESAYDTFGPCGVTVRPLDRSAA